MIPSIYGKENTEFRFSYVLPGYQRYYGTCTYLEKVQGISFSFDEQIESAATGTVYVSIMDVWLEMPENFCPSGAILRTHEKRESNRHIIAAVF